MSRLLLFFLFSHNKIPSIEFPANVYYFHFDNLFQRIKPFVKQHLHYIMPLYLSIYYFLSYEPCHENIAF